MFRYPFVTILFFVTATTFSQEISIKAGFLTDSVSIGKAVPYGIGVYYTSDIDLLLPDSTYNFSPFEYVSKQWFPSNTKGDITFDSVVYYLRTFEIDSIQSLRLSLHQVQYGDSTTIFTSYDSIALLHMVTDLPDSIEKIFLIETTDYYRLKPFFNYPYFIAFTFLFLLVSGVGWLAFGKKIMQAIQIKRAHKRYSVFLKKFDALHSSLSGENLIPDSERLLIHWKKYMENLEKYPYLKLTTSELKKANKDEKMVKALQGIDRIIYAGNKVDSTIREFEELRFFTEEIYLDKIEKMKHGLPN